MRVIQLLSFLVFTATVTASPLHFTDVTKSAGVNFVHNSTVDHRSGAMAAGGAAGDFNGDGYADLFVIGGGDRPDALFINNRNGTFTDRAQEWQLATLHRGVGATTGDYDGDGDLDLYVTSFGPTGQNATYGQHRLYRNEGDHFVNVAEQAGVATTTTTHPDGYGAAFGDYDRDGDLDLFVGAWHNAPVLGARLFQNQGDGRFQDVTQQARLIMDSTRAFGAVWQDMDNDFYPELLVAGDFGTNRYYRNNRNGTFTEIDPGTGRASRFGPPTWSIGKAHNAMGTTVGDFNRDGRPDWFVTAIWPTANFDSDFWGNGLYINQGNHTYTEEASGFNASDGGWGWGTESADFDNDGWTDLVMTNGWPTADIVTGEHFTNESSYLWRNNGRSSFEQLGIESGFNHTGQGRALLTLDYDRDGDMDIAILSYEEPLRLFRNDLNSPNTSPDHHWLQIAIRTSQPPPRAPHGLNAKITVVAGGVSRTQTISSGGSYLGQSERVVHFGLGNSDIIQKLIVDWGDGRPIKRRRVRVDQRITLMPGPINPAH